MTDRLVTVETLAAALHATAIDCLEEIEEGQPTRHLNTHDGDARAVLAAIPPTCANCGAVAHPETPHYFDKPAPDPRLDALLAAARADLDCQALEFGVDRCTHTMALRDAIAAFKETP